MSPASASDALASGSSGPVLSSPGSRPRCRRSCCARRRIVSSTYATSASLGAAAGANASSPPGARLSCHRFRFRANEVRLLLGVIAYNLGNLLRRLVLPLAIQSWSLTSLQQRLFKTGGRLIRHARYFILQLGESYLTSTLFRQILRRIERLGWNPT